MASIEETVQTADNALTPCECGHWAAVHPDFDGEGNGIAATTECDMQHTRRTFRPGHDAKLKSLLIFAGANQLEIVWLPVPDGRQDAQNVAYRYGFGHMVATGVEKAVAKRDAKIARDAAKAKRREARAQELGTIAQRKAQIAAKKAVQARKNLDKLAEAQTATPTEAEAPKPAFARIKVGRWEYDAIISPEGEATFTRPNGETETREAGAFRLLQS